MGFFDSVMSVATGGLSDVVKGDSPFSGISDTAGKYLAPFLNPGAVSGLGVYKGIKDGDWAKALQYAVDPISEPGIDLLARKSGKLINDAVPGIDKYYTPIGTAVGTVVAPGWGTLAGYELTNKMAQGSAQQGVIGGATIGATYGLGALAGELGGLSSYGDSLARSSGGYASDYAPSYALADTGEYLAAGTAGKAAETGGLMSKAKDIGAEVLKQGGKIALNNYLQSRIPEMPSLMELPSPLNNYGYNPSQLPQVKNMASNVNGLIPSNVDFTSAGLKDKYSDWFSEYTKDYENLSEQQKKAKEKKLKEENKYIFDPANAESYSEYLA